VFGTQFGNWSFVRSFSYNEKRGVPNKKRVHLLCMYGCMYVRMSPKFDARNARTKDLQTVKFCMFFQYFVRQSFERGFRFFSREVAYEAPSCCVQ